MKQLCRNAANQINIQTSELFFFLTPDSLCSIDFSLCNDSSSDCSTYSMFPLLSLLDRFTLYFSNYNNQDITLKQLIIVSNQRQNVPNAKENSL